MGIDRGKYTSRRVAPGHASWKSASDWESGDLSSVEVENDGILFRGEPQYGEPPVSGIARWPLEENADDVWGNREGANKGVSFTTDADLGSGVWFNPNEQDYIALPQLGYTGAELSIFARVKPSYHGESPYDRVVSAGTYQPFNLVIYGHGTASWEPYFDITTESKRATAGEPWLNPGQTFAWGKPHDLLGVYGDGFVRMSSVFS